MFSAYAFTILCTGIWMFQSATGSTITDVSSISVTEGEPALIPWNYSLTGGQTVDEIIWTKLPSTPILTVTTGLAPVYGPGYSTRASTTPGTAYLQLTNTVSNDEATYRCQIVFDDLSLVEDEAQLLVTVPTTAPPPSTVPVTNSNTAPEQTTTENDTQHRGWVCYVIVIIYLCPCIGTEICMMIQLVAYKREAYRVVKNVAFYGSVAVCLLTIVVIIIIVVVHYHIVIIVVCIDKTGQLGFIIILAFSIISLVLIGVAAACRYKNKKSSVDDILNWAMKFQLTQASILAIPGLVVSAVDDNAENRVPGVVLGSVCIVGVVVCFLFYKCKKKSCRVSQDLSEPRLQDQVELEQQSAQAEGMAAKPAEPPANEKEEHT